MGGTSDNSSSNQDGTKYTDKNNQEQTYTSTTGYAVYAKDGVAKVVVVTDADVSGSSNDVVFVVANPSAKLNGTGSNKYYVYDAVVNGEVTSIKVKEGSDAQDTLFAIKPTTVKVDGKNVDNKNVGVFFGMTKNASGYVTKLTTATPKDVKVNETDKGTHSVMSTAINGLEYIGTKRESTGGNLTFNTAKTKVSLAANDKALIVYYDGEDLSVANRVSTDTDDLATVVTDDGTVIAILVREMDGSVLTHG